MPPAPTDPLAWTRRHSPILASLRTEAAETRPLSGLAIAVCSSVTTNTGVLVETVLAAGAERVALTAPGPRYNEPAVIEALSAMDGVDPYVAADSTGEDLVAARDRLLESEIEFIVEDGAILSARLHARYPSLAERVIGAAEQTTLGVTRHRAMAREGILQYPVYAVNDAPMKQLVDNIHGTGESTMAAVATTTGRLLTGSVVVVSGYGRCGRGIARKARALGAETIVTEVDSRRAIEARLDGHRVMPMAAAAPLGTYFIAATGGVDVIRPEHVRAMRDGAMVASAGTAAEIDLAGIEAIADETVEAGPGSTWYRLEEGTAVAVLAEGHVVNLAAPTATGHPAEVMDVTFALVYLATRELVDGDPGLRPGVHQLPDCLDRAVADQMLAAWEIEIDDLTDRQRAYREDWEHADTRV